MKKLISKLCCASVVAMLSFSTANAAEPAPVQFTFFDFNAPAASEVSGVRFPAIYGKGGGDITGVDFGLFAYSEMNSLKGVSFSIFPAANHIKGEMVGVSFGIFNWHEGQDTGVNLGFANFTKNVKGVNGSVFNYSKGFTMADVGAVNISQKSNFQLAFVNVTQELDGLQLGLINCAKNGFLPCFIFFNFGTSK
jgi:hypothetical protein